MSGAAAFADGAEPGVGDVVARGRVSGSATRPSSADIHRLKVAMILASMPTFDSTMTRHPLNRHRDSVTAVC
jgi:hypothetical protein